MADLKNIDPMPAPREVGERTEPVWKALAGWMTALRDLIRNRDIEGNGSPEGIYAAAPGTLYRRRDGGVGTSIYKKETAATLTTGWTAL